jgi:CRISPR system Cascade subunit CasE
MYFSRVRLEEGNINLTLLKVLKGDMNAAHQIIWKLFPDKPEEKRDFLFRQEFENEQLPISDTRRGLPIFYVISKRAPLAVKGLLRVESKPYSPKLEVGTQLAFNIRVNPVVQQKVLRENLDEWLLARKKRGLKEKEPTQKRCYHDVLMDAKFKARAEGLKDSAEIQQRMNKAVIDWFTKKGSSCGFEISISNFEISAYCQHLLPKRGKKGIQFSSVDLSGLLRVTDQNLFSETLFKGIGHSKAFGCGMLMIRRV